MLKILNEFNNSNSRNYKLDVLKKYKDNQGFIKVFQLCYDKVKYNFGITMKNINIPEPKDIISLQEALSKLDDLITRKYTGNAANAFLTGIFSTLSQDNQEVLKRIIDRDLRIGVGPKEYNKVVNKKDQIFKLPYMRCSLTDKIKNIVYPAMLQVKMDGTYRTLIKRGTEIECFTRSGEQHVYPKLFSCFGNAADGVYIGELLVSNMTSRYESNGLLNSLNVPEDLDFILWDYLTIDEFNNEYSSTDYKTRFMELAKNIDKTPDNIKRVKNQIVNNADEALHITKQWIEQGEEGAILKDYRTPFENKTSKYQIKIKPEFDVDLKITGFTKGTGKRESLIGAIMYESSDGLLKGQCSGFTDAELEYIANNQDKLLGTIITVIGTVLSKPNGSDTYALLHPRFKEFRTDKTEADDISRIIEISKMIKLF